MYKITCDLHIHSALSPCALEDMTPNNIVNMALLEELTAIAITDHNSCENAKAVMDAALGTGLVVIPGLEIQTREDIHVITLFPNIESAYAMQKSVYAALPDMKAPAKICAKQLILDTEDEIAGFCDKLLSFSCDLTLEEVSILATQLGGIAIPAHIDRKSFSVLSSLGFLPASLSLTTLEISMYAQREEYTKLYPSHRIIQDSDSHELGHIALVRNTIDVESVSPNGIIRALKSRYVG